LIPATNFSDFSSALAVGGVGGVELHTPTVAKTVPISPTTVVTHNYKFSFKL